MGLNQAELEYCRADKWHSAGFTGKGIKVGVYEASGSTVNKTITRFANIIVPPQFSYRVDNSRVNTHAHDVIDSLRFTAPDVEIHMLGNNYDENIQYCIDNKLDFINFSQNGYSYNPTSNGLEAKYVEAGGVPVCSAGNDGPGTLWGTPLKDNWLSVASAAWKQWQGVYQPIHSGFSSSELSGTHLDVTGFGDLRVPDDSDGTTRGAVGTSFACPWVVGLLACWRQWFKAKNNRNPTWQETFGFAVGNCTDMVDPSQNIGVGYEVMTGFGILRLPEPPVESVKPVPTTPTPAPNEASTKIVVKIGSTKATVDGKTVNLQYTPSLVSGHTVLGLRDIGQILGCDVRWDEATQTVTLTKKL